MRNDSLTFCLSGLLEAPPHPLKLGVSECLLKCVSGWIERGAYSEKL
jgi:hypothetical protein